MFGYQLHYTENGQECFIQEDLNDRDPMEWALENYLYFNKGWTDLRLFFEDGSEFLEFPDEFKAMLEKHLSQPSAPETSVPEQTQEVNAPEQTQKVKEAEQVPEPAKKPRKSWLSDIFDFKR
jgi:hypothetical protein